MVWHPPFTFGVVAHIYVLFIFPPFFLRYLMYVHLLPLPTSYFCRLSMKTFAPHATPVSFLLWKPPERKMTLISFVSHSFSLPLFLLSNKWYQWLLSYMTLWPCIWLTYIIIYIRFLYCNVGISHLTQFVF